MERDGDAGPTVRVVLRPIASGLPLGFFAFAVGCMLTSALDLGWIPASEGRQVAILLVTFVAPLQLVAMTVAFLARDPGGATALGLFSAIWSSVAAVTLTLPPATTSTALGTLLLSCTVAIAALAAGAIQEKPVLTAVLGLGVLRFGANGLYQLTDNGTLERLTGWLGLPLCAAAFYLGLALLLEDAAKNTVLPLFRRGSAQRSLEGSFEEQIRDVHQEVGVRNQL